MVKAYFSPVQLSQNLESNNLSKMRSLFLLESSERKILPAVYIDMYAPVPDKSTNESLLAFETRLTYPDFILNQSETKHLISYCQTVSSPRQKPFDIFDFFHNLQDTTSQSAYKLLDCCFGDELEKLRSKRRAFTWLKGVGLSYGHQFISILPKDHKPR